MLGIRVLTMEETNLKWSKASKAPQILINRNELWQRRLDAPSSFFLWRIELFLESGHLLLIRMQVNAMCNTF